MNNNRIRIVIIILALVSGITAILLAVYSVQILQTPPTPNNSLFPPSTCSEQFFYGFESTDMGWEPQTAQNSQAIPKVWQSTKMAKSGHGSLELQVDLDVSNPNKKSGETFINLLSNPPIGLKAPFNLENVPITIWFFAPAAAAGNTENPNGVQIFVKDQQNRSEYGDWGNLTNNTERWIPLIFAPTKNPSKSVYMQDGFDPSRITMIGFKIGTGKDSSTNYSGSLWIDDICWQIP